MLKQNYYGVGRVVAFCTKSGKTVFQDGKIYTAKKNGMWREQERKCKG